MTPPDPAPFHPPSLPPIDHVAPVPRRVRALLGGRTVLDTTRARYVWEWPHYPQYYIPLDDVAQDLLIDEGVEDRNRRGRIRRHGLGVGQVHRPGAAQVVTESSLPGIAGTVRFDWAALDAWFEEDEEVFVHPRDPYSRVDAIRSSRRVQVRLGDTLLAESTAPVLVFETGLPTRYYLPATDLRHEHVQRSPTRTSCPYKGTTSYYLSAVVGGAMHEDIAWCYSFPTAALLSIAGLVAFYQEKVEVVVDGQRV